MKSYCLNNTNSAALLDLTQLQNISSTNTTTKQQGLKFIMIFSFSQFVSVQNLKKMAKNVLKENLK